MKLNDSITKSVAASVSDVLEGKAKKEEAKYPHMMYDPKTGKGVEAKNEKDHEELSKKGYTHEKPKNESPEEPRADGEKEFKGKHTVKKSGEKEDGTVVKEDEDEDEDEVEEAKSKFSKSLLKKASDIALKMGGNMTGAVKKIEKLKKGLSDDPEVKAALQLANEEVTEEVMDEAYSINEAESKKEKYKKVFNAALKKFGVKSPGELEGDKKKEFFDYVDAAYDAGENEGDVDENLLGTIKKAVGKVVGKKKEKQSGPISKSDADSIFNNPGQLKARLAQAKEKLKKTREKWQAAQDKGDDDAEDYWGGIEMKQTIEVEKLEAKLKKARG